MVKKLCPTCRKIKYVKEFYKNVAQKDGVSVSCKECQKKFVKTHYNENKDYYNAWCVLNNKRKKNTISKKEFKDRVAELKIKYKGDF